MSRLSDWRVLMLPLILDTARHARSVSQFKTCDTRLDLRDINGLSVSLISHTRKHAKRLLGYGRISTEAQDLTHQRHALKANGCKVIFEDKASGKSLTGRNIRTIRPALAKNVYALFSFG